jgi:hypothetical protein
MTSAGEIFLWTDDGNRAIEVVLDKNWRLAPRQDINETVVSVRLDSRESVVFFDGSTEARRFGRRPWLHTVRTTFAISNASYAYRGLNGITSIEVANDQIVINLPDGSNARLSSGDRRITFTNALGKRFAF